MAGKKREDPDWARALGDVRPLEDRDKQAPVQAPPQAARAARRSRAKSHEMPPFDPETGRAPDLSRAALRRLRRGDWPVDETLDLHGERAADAERLLRQTLLQAQEAGARCVLVVHGRGLHSPEGAVLKRALPGWLAAAPLASRVLALAEAPPRHGGPGASYILLRRSR